MNQDNNLVEPEALETRIGEMKKQFQKSYDIFIKANDELSKLSFNSLILKDNKNILDDAFSSLNKTDVNEILDAKSIDESLQKLRTKIHEDNEKFKNSFPDVSKLLKIMSNLHVDIESLKEQQNKFVKLTNDIHEEMNRFEKQIDDTASQLEELVTDSSDDDDDDNNFQIGNDTEEALSDYLSD